VTTALRPARLHRFAVIATLAAAPVVGLALSPMAQASTGATPAFSPCGNPKDTTSHIWNGVKHATPMLKLGNRDVVFPNKDRSLGYAVHDGQAKPRSDVNLLVVPTVREHGIECDNLLDAAAPHYFNDAYSEVSLMKGPDWALGINSKDERDQDQLHIHLTRLYGPARADIDRAVKENKVPRNEHDWQKSVIEVTGHDQHGNDNKHAYRAWNTDSMDYNFFAKLNDDIVKPLKKSHSGAGMEHETMLITQNKQGTGFVVLESDRNTGIHGVANIEPLLNKG
jgi:CDP-diacylglycerol pyrophosphatase